MNSSDVQTAAAIINIAINPEFGIHVCNDGNVIAVECLNADAKAVNDKVSVMVIHIIPTARCGITNGMHIRIRIYPHRRR